jgi:uncharacterized protein (TIGR00730 family)
MNIRNICVYCGSSPGNRPDYAASAQLLAKELVQRNTGLVYGGASVGVMGIVASAVLELGGKAIGVMPESLVSKELAHRGLTELHITASMHERKALMVELADGFVALPGGIGTLEEIFETWTWAQLGFHQKPCGLLNVSGFFDKLSEFLDHAVDEQFVKLPHREMLIVESEPAKLLDRFENYLPPAITKWVTKNEN